MQSMSAHSGASKEHDKGVESTHLRGLPWRYQVKRVRGTVSNHSLEIDGSRRAPNTHHHTSSGSKDLMTGKAHGKQDIDVNLEDHRDAAQQEIGSLVVNYLQCSCTEKVSTNWLEKNEAHEKNLCPALFFRCGLLRIALSFP